MSLGPITNELENDAGAPPFGEPVEDSVVGSEEDQRLQRETMEHQLHTQRSALDPKALHGEHSVPGAAPTAAPERDRVRGETLTEEQLLLYRGKFLVDADGGEIGPISCIYLDEATGIPEWLGAQVGSLMGSQRVVAPVFGSYIFKETISVPYARKVILGAEVASTDAMTHERDTGLYLHFGIPMSRKRSPSGLPAGLDARRRKPLERISVPLARILRQVGRPVRGLIGHWRWPWTRAA